MADHLTEADRQLLSAAVDGMLPADEQAAVQARLESDPLLRAEWERLLALKRFARRAFDQEPPESLLPRLRSALDAEFAPRRRAPLPRRRWLLAAAAVLLTGIGLSRLSGPSRVLDPANLAMTHRGWQEHFATATADESPAAMAAQLSRQVGFAVLPPDPTALSAALKACATCDHSVPGGQVALFVMARRDGTALTLYELPARGVTTAGFRDSGTAGVLTAEHDGLRLAAWRDGDVYACLVAEAMPMDELLRLVPQSLRLAAEPGPVRFALL